MIIANLEHLPQNLDIFLRPLSIFLEFFLKMRWKKILGFLKTDLGNFVRILGFFASRDIWRNQLVLV